jgi:GT2 family glycosyltransferase
MHPPQSRALDASIVILARHRPERLSRCLETLAALPDPGSREVLVLLNDADDGVRAVLDAPPLPLRVLASAVNMGFAAGCNMLSKLARGRYLVFLNDDTEVEVGWLQPLIETADRDPRAGAVGSCVLFADGSIQEAGAVIWQDGSTTSLGRDSRPGSPAVSFVREVDYCSACSLLVRREAWTAAGGFCEDYFPAYYEDVELCLSLRALGYRVLYQPRSRVRHHGGSSTDPDYRLFLNNYQRQRFLRRWAHVLDHLEPADATSPAAITRAAFRASGRVRRVLIIQDRLPAPTTGGRSDRSWNAVVELVDNGYAVSVWPSRGLDDAFWELGQQGIEVIAEDLRAHLREPAVLYDAVLVSQQDDSARYQAIVRDSQPHSVLVCDADAGHWIEVLSRAQLARTSAHRSSSPSLS